MNNKFYKYTYKYRGFSIGCQPKQGFVEFIEDKTYEYEVIIYNRELTAKEIEDYELIDLNVEQEKEIKLFKSNWKEEFEDAV